MLRVARAAGVAPLAMSALEGRAQALPRGEGTDLEILTLFPAELRAYAVEFRGDHQGHRDTQVSIAQERGGRPPAALGHYDFDPGTGPSFVRQALEIELAAQRAYSALVSHIGTRDYLLSAAFILVDEVRHITVWRKVLGLKIY
jgi:hypothetical protein